MMVRNCELDRLEAKRETVRKEINRLMKRKDYYSNIEVYKRVSALTGLECYLTYRIEALYDRVNSIYDEDNLV